MENKAIDVEPKATTEMFSILYYTVNYNNNEVFYN